MPCEAVINKQDRMQDSRQGGCDGVSTDGILTPVPPPGILQRVCTEDKDGVQMDGAEIILFGIKTAMHVLFHEKRKSPQSSCKLPHQYSSRVFISTNAFLF